VTYRCPRQCSGVAAPIAAHRVLLCGVLVLPVLLVAAISLGRGRRVRAREATAQRLGLDSVDSAEIIVQRGGRVAPAWKAAAHSRSELLRPRSGHVRRYCICARAGKPGCLCTRQAGRALGRSPGSLRPALSAAPRAHSWRRGGWLITRPQRRKVSGGPCCADLPVVRSRCVLSLPWVCRWCFPRRGTGQPRGQGARSWLGRIGRRGLLTEHRAGRGACCHLSAR